MRILVATQGPYGERIARNLREKAPPGWTIAEIALPRALPSLIDDPDEFLPESIAEADPSSRQASRRAPPSSQPTS